MWHMGKNERPKKGTHVTFRLTERDYKRLQSLAQKADVSRSILVRRALLHALPAWEEAIKQDRLALL